jgi:anti-sigma-K factor RskA
MSDARHDRIAGQLIEYALNELTPSERQDVENHLRACAICTQELREINESMRLVADTTAPVEPPQTLKNRVLSAVSVQTQEPAPASAFGSQRAAVPSSSSQRLGRTGRGLSLAAAVVIVALAATLYVRESSRRTLLQNTQRASAEVTNLRQQLDRFSAQTDLALSILTAGDMRELSLAGRENAVAAAARAYWSPTRGLLVVADRLPAAPSGRIYQVWVINNGQPASAGLLGEPASGRGMLVAPPPRPGTGSAVTIAITDEPPGGLSAPSGTIRLAGSI